MTPLGRACRDTVVAGLTEYNLPTDESGICILCMIAAHESGEFKYTRQLSGPAVTHFQIEPNTYNDLVMYQSKRGLDLPDPPAEYLIFDGKLAAAYARVFFMRFPEKLPDSTDIKGMSEYAKLKWNTEYGKATPKQYEDAYRKHFE